MVRLKDGREVYGIIYKITNRVNGKVYIGQTTQEKGFKDRYWNKGKGIERVLNYHIKRRDQGFCYNKHIVSSIEKYGMKNWDIDEEFDIAFSEEELNEKEEYYIELFMSSYKEYGYNSTLGGDNSSRSEDVVNEIKFRVSIPIKCKETKEVFLSAVDLANSLGLKSSGHINRAIKTKGIYKNNGKTYKLCSSNEGQKAVICLNNMKPYYNAVEAAKANGINRYGILKCCNGKLKSTKNNENEKLKWMHLYKLYDYFK